MKKLIILFLCFVTVISLFAGCTQDEKSPETTDLPITEPSAPQMPEIEYTDVVSLICGDIIGKPEDNFGLPEELVFLTGENVIGYDYVSVGDLIGNLTCYYDETGIYSAAFGSAPYKNKDEFSSAFEVVSQLISEKLGVEITETTFNGGNEDEDKLESLFAGKCIMIAEYKTSKATVKVTGGGVNGMATVVVECGGAA